MENTLLLNRKSVHQTGVTPGGSGDGDPPDIDPIITGLLAWLPKSGTVWPEAQRDLWLDLLRGSFKLIYEDKEMLE